MQDYFLRAIDYIQQRRWLGHVLFWLLFFLIQALSTGSEYYETYQVAIHKFIMLFPKIAATYLLIYYQIPQFLYKRKYLLFIVSFIVTSYIFTAGARILVVHLVEELVRPKPFVQESVLEILTDIKRLYSNYYLGVYFPALLLYIVKLIKEKSREKSQLELLEKEKFSAELNFFKAQIHPHFLFNTLNNLYTLTLQKSDKASETVLKLSEILDYMLYKCNDNRVAIEKELNSIQNYIDLEQLRYGDRLELIFTKNVDNLQTPIAPLILMSLIENAFKHGASGAIDKPMIKIDISVKDKQLAFSVFNTKTATKQADETNFKSGIGLNNIKNQLQLIYPNKHLLEINEQELSYHVKLNVDLG